MKRAALIVLGFVAFLLPQAAMADPDRCLERGYLHHFDVRFAVEHTEPCEQVAIADISWGGRTVHLKAIRLRSTPITDSPMLATRVSEAAVGVGAALSRMGGRLELDQVTLLLTNWVSPEEHDPHGILQKGDYIAGAHRTAAGAECPVAYYKSRTRTDGDGFVFTLSHEIFHCVQYKTWRDLPEQQWIYEGTAEYFGHLAKAGYRDIIEFTRFDNAIATTPLDRMSYEAEVFYLWLSHAYGPPRVREFIETIRRIQDAIEPDMWIHFGQDYFDSRIPLPDGRRYPGNPRISGTLDIHGDETFQLTQSEPYTLSQVIYAFERGKFFDIIYTPRPPDARILWRKADGGSWTTPLTSVSTCDGPQRYRVIWGSTRSRDYGRMTVNAQPASASACSCPAGVWQETQESLKAVFEQSVTGGAPPKLLSGSRTLTLNPDHTGSFIYNDVVTRTEDRRDFWVKQVKSGGTHFTWKTVNGMLLTMLTRGADNLLTLNNDIHVAFSGTRHETRRTAAQSIGHQFSCDAAGLHLIQHSRGPGLTGNPFNVNYNVDMHFMRIGGVAPPH